MYGLIEFYKENAKILKDTFQQMGFSVYGESQDKVSVCARARVRVPAWMHACMHTCVGVSIESLVPPSHQPGAMCLVLQPSG